MSDLTSGNGHPAAGYRLHKLELYNWGTFDSSGGQVYTVRPDGQTTLLIGQNGTGKSTLVDALLTLLVRPVLRSYNVAAGGSKQERDERTYIRGAYGRFSRDEDNRAEVQFLRPQGSNYSALLGCFRNSLTGEAFTVAQVLYLNSEGRAEKVYLFSSGERSIAEDCAGLANLDRVRQQLEKRGFRATLRYSEFHLWLARATGIRSKAMDMFNQTVAVKDIQSLNRFIREHMLEAKPWSERVDSLLTHFTQLSEAHQSLVRVRRQDALLQPIVEQGAAYRQESERLASLDRLLSAADCFFRQQTLELFEPQCDQRRRSLQQAQLRKERLGREITENQDECRRLKNEIEQAGGERLRHIPLLMEKLQLEMRTRREARQRFQLALQAAGIPTSINDEPSFATLHQELPALINHLNRELVDLERRRVDLAVQHRDGTRQLIEDEREYNYLQGRKGNLPEALREVRLKICEHLGLSEHDLPFVAELMAVHPAASDWEVSIEMVLRPFALSLLVPSRFYQQVSAYVERTRQEDARGRGQRLVYIKVSDQPQVARRRPVHRQSLVHKLSFQEKHPLATWVRAELEERFDFRCCETMEDFQAAGEMALTRERHMKSRGARHDKDDRDRISDPRRFVLGWNNDDKCRHLAELIQQRRAEMSQLARQLADVETQLAADRERQAALQTLLRVHDFRELDYLSAERQLAELSEEKQAIEQSHDVVAVLRQRLADIESQGQGLQALRDDAVGTERELQRHIADGERLTANARKKIDAARRQGTLDHYEAGYSLVADYLADRPLTADNLFEREREFFDSIHRETDRLRRTIEPLRNDLTSLMGRFLREFPQERTDLEPTIDYLDSFAAVQEQIRQEDLPKHERRFKERLNEKVLQEAGLLHGALQAESIEIRSRIELLNRSLRQMEYRRGTRMQLEPRPVRDREVAEFQQALKSCLADTAGGTDQAEESRFLQIEKLITRLREDQRWREKVTDVRRWYDFVARELDHESGEERGYYEDSTGQSGGEKAKLAFTILVAAIAYQYDIDPQGSHPDRFRFVVVDEMFSKVDDHHAEYALELFKKFGLQLLIVAPLDAKARVTEPFVGCYLHVVKDARTNHSELYSMTAREFADAVAITSYDANGKSQSRGKQPRRVPR